MFFLYFSQFGRFTLKIFASCLLVKMHCYWYHNDSTYILDGEKQLYCISFLEVESLLKSGYYCLKMFYKKSNESFSKCMCRGVLLKSMLCGGLIVLHFGKDAIELALARIRRIYSLII